MFLFDEMNGQFKDDFEWDLTNSHPGSVLEGQKFQGYIAFLLWFWANSTGFGFEIFFLAVTVRKGGWSQSHEDWYRLIQHTFPIVAAAAFGMASFRNYLAFVFLVISNWKVSDYHTAPLMQCM